MLFLIAVKIDIEKVEYERARWAITKLIVHLIYLINEIALDWKCQTHVVGWDEILLHWTQIKKWKKKNGTDKGCEIRRNQWPAVFVLCDLGSAGQTNL